MKVLLLVAAMLAGSAAAMPSFAQLLRCGDVVRSSVKLEQDLECPGTALYVGAHGVRIDLQGHTIRWAAPPYADPDKILFRGYGIRNDGVLPDLNNPGQEVFVGGGFDGVRVENGSIERFNVAIYLSTTSHNTLTNLHLANQRRRRVTNGYIDGVGIVASLANDALLIENNTIEKNDRGGIAVDGLLCGKPVDTRVEGSAVYACGDNVIRGNVIRDNNATPEGAEIYGIQLLQTVGTEVIDNTVEGHTKAEQSLYNAGEIVVVSSRGDEISGNNLKGGEVGLLMVDLTSRPTTNVSVVKNRAWKNNRHGFVFRTEAPATINEITTRVEGNVAEQNGGSGFVYDATSQEPAQGAIQFEANEATQNAGYGVYVPGAFDLGRNRASQNRVDECVGVVCQ
ncbi:MAG: right-handed parallel beta-helix repeat-containing protein [Bryobacterales bacterium]|nr:right-handed parallel beta-helix repeat-containing protein [Bryobacterales bacterium]